MLGDLKGGCHIGDVIREGKIC